MTGKTTSEASVSSPAETEPEPAKVPTTESSGEEAASDSTGQGQAPEPQKLGSQALDPAAPEASATPATTKPEPPSEDVPSAPLQLTLEDVSHSSLTVSWEPPEKLGKLGLQGYVLELCREGGEYQTYYRFHSAEVGQDSRDKPSPHNGSVQGNIKGEGVSSGLYCLATPLLCRDLCRKRGSVTSGDLPSSSSREPLSNRGVGDTDMTRRKGGTKSQKTFLRGVNPGDRREQETEEGTVK